MNWMVNCVVESFKDNNQSTISCSGKEDLVTVIKFSAKCQKLVGRRKVCELKQVTNYELIES